LIASRILSAIDPARLLPLAFAASAAALLGLSALTRTAPDIAGVGVYLHFSVFGAILISWFWSMLNEALDPNTARKRIGAIATGATLGGLLGGVAAERVAANASLGAMLPILAALHLVCAVLARLAARAVRSERPHAPPETGRSSMRILSEMPYLRQLAALVLVVTVCGELLDYVFKERAASAFRGEELLRFFGLFYTATALLPFSLQTIVT
jgi:AAA family ATP:ADP antiporter